MSSEGCAKKRS